MADIFPNLLSLDLCYNLLWDLATSLQAFQSLPKLRQLTLVGNPIYLLKFYRTITLRSLPNLMVLDDIKITVDERNIVSEVSTDSESLSGNLECPVTIELRMYSVHQYRQYQNAHRKQANTRR